MKSLLLTLLFILLSSFQWIYVINNDVNLRKGPDNKKRVLTTVPKGEEITVLEKTNEWWWQVSYKGKKGYIAATFIDRSYSKTLLTQIQANPQTSIFIGVAILFVILILSRKKKPIPKRSKKK
jgi:uncharacterized protein YgiM (DUF1202 family)